MVPAGYLTVEGKLDWYVTPVYPFLSLFFVVAVRALITWLSPKAAWTRPAVIALTCAAAALAVSAMAIRVDRGDYYRPLSAHERYPAQLAAFRATFPGTKHIVLGTPTYQGPGLYYQKYFAERGLRIERQRVGRIHLQPGDTILTSEEPIKRVLRDDYDTKKIFSFEGMEGEVVRKARQGNSQPASRRQSTP